MDNKKISQKAVELIELVREAPGSYICLTDIIRAPICEYGMQAQTDGMLQEEREALLKRIIGFSRGAYNNEVLEFHDDCGIVYANGSLILLKDDDKVYLDRNRKG